MNNFKIFSKANKSYSINDKIIRLSKGVNNIHFILFKEFENDAIFMDDLRNGFLKLNTPHLDEEIENEDIKDEEIENEDIKDEEIENEIRKKGRPKKQKEE